MKRSLIYKKAEDGYPVNPYTGGYVDGMSGGRSKVGGGGDSWGKQNAGAIAAGANALIQGVAMPLLTNWEKKKANKKVKAAGLRTNEEMETYAKDVNNTITALGAQPLGGLFKGGGGILYTKTQS